MSTKLILSIPSATSEIQALAAIRKGACKGALIRTQPSNSTLQNQNSIQPPPTQLFVAYHCQNSQTPTIKHQQAAEYSRKTLAGHLF